MRRDTCWGWLLAWGLIAGAGLATTARAQDEPAATDDDDDEFETNWFGVRIGLWYRPAMDMNMKVNGTPKIPGIGGLPGGLTTLIGTSIDIEDDLGVSETVQCLGMENGVLEGEVFFDSEWVSLSLWGVAPFAYEGEKIITRTINFGGMSFSANLATESRFEQWFAGADFKLNLLNNRIVALSPIIGLRVLGIDWEIEGVPPPPLPTIKGDTSDIDSPLKLGDDQMIPYPVIGAEIKVGIRRWLEADLKVTGIYIVYQEVEGGSIQGDAGVTFWPVPWVGLRLGGRYTTFDFETKDQDDSNSFDFDLDYLGFNVQLIVRI